MGRWNGATLSRCFWRGGGRLRIAGLWPMRRLSRACRRRRRLKRCGPCSKSPRKASKNGCKKGGGPRCRQALCGWQSSSSILRLAFVASCQGCQARNRPPIGPARNPFDGSLIFGQAQGFPQLTIRWGIFWEAETKVLKQKCEPMKINLAGQMGGECFWVHKIRRRGVGALGWGGDEGGHIARCRGRAGLRV